MGLDITFMTKQKGKEYLSKYWLGEDADEALLKLESEKNEISKRRMSEEGDEERFEFLKKEIGDKVDAINEANGITELYFRKVPRVVYVGLFAALLQEGGADLDGEAKITEDALNILLAANAMSVDPKYLPETFTEEKLRCGTVNLYYLKKAFDVYFNDEGVKGMLDELGKRGGFFWGKDEWTEDEEIKEEYGKFLAEVERLQTEGKLSGKDEDVEVEYDFSW